MLITKKSWNLSLDSLSDTMTNSVGILILMLLSVTVASIPKPKKPPEITKEMMDQAQARCAQLESRQKQLQQQWEELRANEERKQRELESLQARLKDLQRFAEMPQNALAECVGLNPAALKSLLRTADGRQEKLTEIQGILADARSKLDVAKAAVENKYNSVSLEKVIKALAEKMARLEEEKAGLERALALRQDEEKRIQELKRGLEMLKKEIEHLKAYFTASGPWPMGGYNGPFILVECDDKGATVYPGAKQISVGVLANEKTWLKEKVLEKGAALLITRPSGFEKSYPAFKEVLVETAKEYEGKDGHGIILTFWPIEEHTDISKYMPQGETK